MQHCNKFIETNFNLAFDPSRQEIREKSTDSVHFLQSALVVMAKMDGLVQKLAAEKRAIRLWTFVGTCGCE